MMERMRRINEEEEEKMEEVVDDNSLHMFVVAAYCSRAITMSQARTTHRIH